ncbi:MAG: HNH endonuclease signature motif containing protein [Alphaproteobacteria bacterium]|nr:HNH endonuclease signature motif containing protein [Alphaproteobacteria bacterium]
MKTPRLTTFKPSLATISGRTISLPPKTVDPVYQTPEHRAWRDHVVDRAGGRCEHVGDDGRRCLKARPRHRMFADHVREIRDGGATHDLANGQCLCGAHHTAKTARARAARRFT